MTLGPRIRIFIAAAFATYIVAFSVIFFVFPANQPHHEAASEDIRRALIIPFKDIPILSADQLPGYWLFPDIFQVVIFPFEGSASEFFLEFSGSSGHEPFELEYVRQATYRDGVLYLNRPTSGGWTHPGSGEKWGWFEPYTELVPLGWPNDGFRRLIPKYLLDTGQFVGQSIGRLHEYRPMTPDGERLGPFLYRGTTHRGKNIETWQMPFPSLRRLPRDLLPGVWEIGRENSLSIDYNGGPEWPFTVTFEFKNNVHMADHVSIHRAIYRDGVIRLETPYPHCATKRIPMHREGKTELRNNVIVALHAAEIDRKDAHAKEPLMLIPAKVSGHERDPADNHESHWLKDTRGRLMMDQIYYKTPETPVANP